MKYFIEMYKGKIIYVLISFLATIFDFCITYVLIDVININYYLGLAISFLIASSFIFYFNLKYTFKKKPSRKVYIYFTLYNLFICIISSFLIMQTFLKLHINIYLSKILFIPFFLIINYFCRKFIVRNLTNLAKIN